MAKGINQGPAKGAYEPRILRKDDGFGVQMGNNNCFDTVGKEGAGGGGRTIYGSGLNAPWSTDLKPTPTPSPPMGRPVQRPRSGDVMSNDGED